MVPALSWVAALYSLQKAMMLTPYSEAAVNLPSAPRIPCTDNATVNEVVGMLCTQQPSSR